MYNPLHIPAHTVQWLVVWSVTGDNRQVRVLSKCIIITTFTTLIEQSAQFTLTPGSIAHGSARAGATAPTVARPGSITVKEGFQNNSRTQAQPHIWGRFARDQCIVASFSIWERPEVLNEGAHAELAESVQHPVCLG